METPQYRVLIVGLGAVAQTHLKVLERIPGAEVVVGVDTDREARLTFRDRPVPVHYTIRDIRDQKDPDVVVVATPTPTHAAVCAEVADNFPDARILVEKPAADNLSDARYVLEEIGRRQPVDVAYHMAFSPEVLWGARMAQSFARDLGMPKTIVASFTDPYQLEFESASSRFGSSWIDSGINSLSILSRFVDLVGRRSLRSIGEKSWSAFEAHITCRAADSSLEALILTSWHVTDPSRTTRIRYASGAELVMDHAAVAGYLLQDGGISALFGSDRSVPRRERHYRELYQWWLVDGNPVIPTQTSLYLHELLLQRPDETQEQQGFGRQPSR